MQISTENPREPELLDAQPNDLHMTQVHGMICGAHTGPDELLGIVKSEVRQSHSIFLRMFFENIQPVTRHYGAPWGAY